MPQKIFETFHFSAVVVFEATRAGVIVDGKEMIMYEDR